MDAILATWYPGEEGGTAFARLLFGDANPSGHLPVSWERRISDNPSYAYYYPQPGTDKVHYGEGIHVGYRGYERNHVEPLYPFGFGLSYTTFSMSNLQAEPSGPGRYKVSFDVTNTSARGGATVAQVYVAEEKPSVDRPGKELEQFERVMLGPKETRHVTVELNPRSFAFYDVKQKAWHADAGAYQVLVGDSSSNTPLHAPIQLSAPIVLPVDESGT